MNPTGPQKGMYVVCRDQLDTLLPNEYIDSLSRRFCFARDHSEKIHGFRVVRKVD